MKLISFFLKCSARTLICSVCMGLISGASNASLLALFNTGLRSRATPLLVWSFVGLCFLIPLSRAIAEILLSRLSQAALCDSRMRLSDQLLAAPLRHIEEVGAHR